jgi:recombination protein RecA
MCCITLLPWFLINIDSQFHLQQKALDAAMSDINNSFGKGSVTRLGSAGGAFVYVSNFLNPSLKSSFYIYTDYYCHHPSETFPSGCLTLDFALGGGLPKGRVVEVFFSSYSFSNPLTPTWYSSFLL